MTQPLREDFPIYDLPSEKVIDGPWPAAQTPAAVLSNPDLIAPPKKKPRKKKSATGRKRGRPVKAKASVGTASTTATISSPAPDSDELRIAPSGEGVWPRIRRIKADQWVWILIPVAAVALAVSLAFLTGAVKL